MSALPHRRWCKILFISVLFLCLLVSAAAVMVLRKNDVKPCIGADHSFSVLILGDSQMAGAGWKGGYGNCISEAYPNAKVTNLAQNGSCLANGDIHAQWEFYLSEFTDMPDFVLLDGGINDLPYLQREEFKDTGFSIVSDALCSLVEEIHEANPDTRILYTLMPPLAEWKDSDNGPPSYEIQEHYWKKMNIIASAYDYITVLDLFSINPFGYPCVACYRENLADSIHLSEAGYRKTFEYINNALVPHLALQLDE